MQTLSTCAPERMQAAGVPVPQYDLDIHEQVKDKGPGGHILTGPVAIEERRNRVTFSKFRFRR